MYTYTYIFNYIVQLHDHVSTSFTIYLCGTIVKSQLRGRQVSTGPARAREFAGRHGAYSPDVRGTRWELRGHIQGEDGQTLKAILMVTIYF